MAVAIESGMLYLTVIGGAEGEQLASNFFTNSHHTIASTIALQMIIAIVRLLNHFLS